MIKVGVLRGGPSAEHTVSLKTGESVLSSLSEKYEGHDIFLSPQGNWFLDGKTSYPEQAFRSVDVVFNALHGQFGEDGKVQQILETFGIPYTGSGILASAIGMNKMLARETFSSVGLRIPRAVAVNEDEDIEEAALRIFRKMGPSLVVKPLSSGSSMGVSVVHDYSNLIKSIERAFLGETGVPLSESRKIIVEEYIKGKEATCGVIENFKNEKYYALPIVEIVPPDESDFFDYGAKYGGTANEICPANFSKSEKVEMENIAREAHKAVGCRHYSQSDFIISPRGIYILEINTLPGLTKESLLPRSVEVAGVSYSDFLTHLIEKAVGGH